MKITGAHLPSLGYQELDTGHGKLSPNSICACPAMSISCAGWCARQMSSRRDIVLAPWPIAACRQRNWLRSGLVSSTSRLCLRSRGPLGVTARFRHGGANRQRHDDTSGGVHPGEFSPGAAILPGLGDRLLHRLLDGIWRDGGIGTSDAGRWQLVGTDLSRSGRQVDHRSRRSAGCGA